MAEEEPVIEFSFNEGTSFKMGGLSDRLKGLKVVAVELKTEGVSERSEPKAAPFRRDPCRKGVGERSEQNKVRIYGDTPGRVCDAVFQFAKDKGIEIASVNSIKPSLEDAFIKITGLSSTVMTVEKGGR